MKKRCASSYTFRGSWELKLSGIKDLMSTPKLQSFSSKLPLEVCELAHHFKKNPHEANIKKKNALISLAQGSTDLKNNLKI